jgi:hypothetical protein
MRKFALILLLVFSFAAPSDAQRNGQWQLFAGYSYMRANVREYFKSTPIVYSLRNQYANLNGWNVSITENVNKWFGGTLDVSGHYGSPSLQGTNTTQQAYTVSYGPQFFHQGRSLRLFGHVLGGLTHISTEVSPTGPHASGTSFTIAPGGGLDMHLFKYGSLRLFQAEYFHTNLQGSSNNQLRISTGIVFDLNKK